MSIYLVDIPCLRLASQPMQFTLYLPSTTCTYKLQVPILTETPERHFLLFLLHFFDFYREDFFSGHVLNVDNLLSLLRFLFSHYSSSTAVGIQD